MAKGPGTGGLDGDGGVVIDVDVGVVVALVAALVSGPDAFDVTVLTPPRSPEQEVTSITAVARTMAPVALG